MMSLGQDWYSFLGWCFCEAVYYIMILTDILNEKICQFCRKITLYPLNYNFLYLPF